MDLETKKAAELGLVAGVGCLRMPEATSRQVDLVLRLAALEAAVKELRRELRDVLVSGQQPEGDYRGQ